MLKNKLKLRRAKEKAYYSKNEGDILQLGDGVPSQVTANNAASNVFINYI